MARWPEALHTALQQALRIQGGTGWHLSLTGEKHRTIWLYSPWLLVQKLPRTAPENQRVNAWFNLHSSCLVESLQSHFTYHPFTQLRHLRPKKRQIKRCSTDLINKKTSTKLQNLPSQRHSGPHSPTEITVKWELLNAIFFSGLSKGTSKLSRTNLLQWPANKKKLMPGQCLHAMQTHL